MTFLRIINVKGRHYLYEKESYWDKELKKPRQRVVRYLGPCDGEGHLISKPSLRINSIHSAFPSGTLSVFYAMASLSESTLNLFPHIISMPLTIQLRDALEGMP
jgi:hypothetical protein